MSNNCSSSAVSTPKGLNIKQKAKTQLIIPHKDSCQNFCISSPTLKPPPPKKTIYSKITEDLINNLHKKGTIELHSCYDNLTKRNNDFEILNHDKSPPSPTSPKKIINDFLNRNIKEFNMKRVFPNSLSQKNGLIKKTASPECNENLQCIGKIRSPQKYMEDQIQYMKRRNKKIETHRNKIAKKELEYIQSKPKINKHSVEIVNRNRKRKNGMNRLFKGVAVSARMNYLYQLSDENQDEGNKSKNKEKNGSIEHGKDDMKLKNNNKNSKKSINKLYKGSIVRKTTRSQTNNPHHRQKKIIFDSNDNVYSNRKVRDNNKNEKYNTSRSPYYSNRNKTDEIILNKVLKDIDYIIKDDSKVKINYFEFCDILYQLGCVEYDHMTIIKEEFNDKTYINYKENKNEIEKVLLLTYNNNKLQYILQKLNDEQNLINKAWKFIINNFILTENNNTNNENIFTNSTIPIQDFKIFIIIILNLIPTSNSIKQKSVYNNPNKLSPNNSIILHKNNSKSISNTSIIDQNSQANLNKEIIKRALSFNIKTIIKSFEYFRLTKIHKDSLLPQTRPESSSNIHNLNQNTEFTFKPKIKNPNAKSTNLEETYSILQQKHKNKMIELQKEKIINELKECTFAPNNKKIDSSKSIEISNRLYNVSKRKKTENFNSPPSSSLNEKECTFMPATSKLNEEIFTNNPLKNDPLVNCKVEQYEKARIEKKLISYINCQGGPSVFKLKNSEELLKCVQGDHNYEAFKFGIEHKTNKDTFDTFKNKDKNLNGIEHKKMMPLFTIEVKIKDRVEFLDYYKNENPAEITKRFCQRYGLGENSNEKILAVIEEKLRNND